MTEYETSHLDLRKIAESGQVFRWVELHVPDSAGRCLSEPTDDHVCPASAFAVESSKHRARLSQHGDILTIESDDNAYFEHYLGLDADYDAAYDALAAVPGMADAVLYGDGIRIVNQDWFETAVTFIVSQNNNIPRIKQIVRRLCADQVEGIEDAQDGLQTGPGAAGASKPVSEADDIPVPASFPDASELSRRVSQDGCGLGYRRSYIGGLAERVADGWRPRSASYAEAREELQGLAGVGPKVADCICLYGLGFMEAHPVDVWIERALEQMNVAWHPRYAGLQQQLMYYWIRSPQEGTSSEALAAGS